MRTCLAVCSFISRKPGFQPRGLACLVSPHLSEAESSLSTRAYPALLRFWYVSVSSSVVAGLGGEIGREDGVWLGVRWMRVE